MADIKKNVSVNVKGKGVKKTTAELNNLNDAIKKADKGTQAHSKSSRTLDRNLKGNAKMSSNASKNFSKQAQSMQGILVPAYAEVAARVFALTAAYNALNRAAQFNVLMKGQQAFAAQTGKNMAAIARSLQEASGYMLDFQQASSSTALGTTAGLTQKTLLRMTKGARAASVALGIDMTNAMDRLTRGIVKAEPEILDELGVIIRLDKVYQDFAFSVGKTTSQLTEQEKQTARSAAILGQLEGKFGAIGEQVEANPFAKLAAAVTDLVTSFGAGATDIIGPFIARLADSTELLIGLMAMVVRSLAGKVLPIFSDIDKKLGSMVDRAKEFQATSKKLRVQRMQAAGNQKGILEQKQKDELTQFFNLLGKAGGNAVQETLKSKKDFLKTFMSGVFQSGLGAAIAGAKRDIARQERAGVVNPVARTPAFAGYGFDLRQLQALENLRNSIRGIGKDINNINKATKGSMVIDFMGILEGAATRAASGVAGMTQSFAEGAKEFSELTDKGETATSVLKDFYKTASRMKFAGAAAAASLRAMSKALNAIVSFFAIKMTVTWIAEEALNMSDAFSKASKALNALNSDLEETIGLLQERGAKRFDPGMTIADSLNSSQAVASIADGLYTAMEKAAVRLDEKHLEDALLGSWYDAFLDLFGAGIQSKIEESISSALVAMSANMKPQVWKDFKEQFDIRNQLAESLDISSGKDLAAGTALGLTAAVATGAGAITFASGGILAPIAAAAVAITAALESLDYFREGFDKLGMSAEDAADSIIKTLDDVNEGTLTVAMAVDEIQRLMQFDDKETAIAYYRDITAASKLYAETTKKTADAIKALNDSSNNLMKTQTSFSRGLITGGDLKDFADAAKATRQALGSTEVKNYIKFRELNDKGFFGTNYSGMAQADRSRFTGLEDAINAEKKNLAEIQASVKDLKVKEQLKTDSQKRINALEEELIQEQTRVYQQEWEKAYEEVRKQAEMKGPLSPSQMANLDTLTARRLTSKLVGGDVEAQYERELKQATRVAHINQTIAENQRFGNSLLKENADLQQEILKLEHKKLIGRRELGKLSGVELENLNGQIDLLERQIKEAGRTAVEASKWANELAGTVETLTQKLDALKKDSPDLVKFEKSKTDRILKAFNAIKNSLTENFDEAQQLNATLSVLDEVNKAGWITSAQGKRMVKDWLLLYSAQGKVIFDRNKQITEELVLLDVNTRHMGEQEDLLDYRLKAAKIDLDTTNSLLRIDKERLKLREAYVKLADLEAQYRDAKMRESLEDYRSVIENVSNAFADSLSEAISNSILDIDTDVDWRTALAEQFAGGAGDVVAGMFQRGIFGNQGLLSGAAKGIFGLDNRELDFLFPKTEVEVIESGIAGLTEAIERQHETIGKIEQNTLRTASGIEKSIEQIPGTVPYSPEWLKGIEKKYPNLIDEGLGNTLGSTAKDQIATWLREGSKGTSNMVAVNSKYDPYNLYGGGFGGGRANFGGPRSIIQTDKTNAWMQTDKLGLKGKAQAEKYLQLQKNLELQNKINKIEGKPPIKFKPDNRNDTNLPATNTPSWIRDLFSSTQETFNKVGTKITENATVIGDSLRNTLNFGFEDLIVNGNLNAKMLASNFVGSVGNTFMNSAADAATGMIFESLGFAAKGGIAMGGIKGYASGGIVSAPHIGVVGEGKYNEAIVPLPDGKAIPVIGNTGGNNNVTVNVSVDSNGQANAQAQGEGNMQQLGYQISQVVQEEIMRQQRPGGLLNSTGTRSY